MDLINILKYVAVVSSIGIIVTVLLQSGSSGGLGAVFGGGGGEAYRSKRGVEALLFNGTIISSIIFAVSALAIAILGT